MSLKVSASDSSARPSFPYPLPSPPAHSRPSRSLRSPATLSSLASHLLTLYPRLQSSSQRPPRADTEACPYNSPLPTPYYLLPTPRSLLPIHQSPSLLVSFLLTPVSLFPSPLSSQRPPRSGTGACPYNSPLPIPYFLLPTPHSLLPIHSSPVTLSSRLFSLDSCLSFPVSALQPTPSAGRHRGLPLQLPTPHSLLPTTYSLFTSHPLFSSLFS